MDVKKTELKDTELNALFLSMEKTLEHYNIEEKVRCGIMLDATAIVTECVKNPPSFEDGKAIHEYCLPYALQFAELSDSPLVKLMSKLFFRIGGEML